MKKRIKRKLADWLALLQERLQEQEALAENVAPAPEHARKLRTNRLLLNITLGMDTERVRVGNVKGVSLSYKEGYRAALDKYQVELMRLLEVEIGK